MTILYYFAGSMDWLFGFNQTDKGLGTLLVLFVSAPILNLSWLVTEIRLSIKTFRDRKTASVLLPLAALIFLAESLAIDFYILTQIRM